MIAQALLPVFFVMFLGYLGLDCSDRGLPQSNFQGDRMNGDLPEKRCPLWVERSLQQAPFVVVVRRANLFDS
jgi:hypothetical protein